MSYTFKNNMIIKTTNGDFMIVSIEVYPENDKYTLCTFGGMYIDDEQEYPFEIQYMDEDVDALIKQISKDGDILEIISPIRSYY